MAYAPDLVSIQVDSASIGSSAAYAPTTSRPGQALNATAQAGVVGLGSNYAATPVAYPPKIDANGTAYTSLVAAGGLPGSYQGGVAVASQSATAGPILMALQGLTAFPLTLDGNQALNTVSVPKQTFRALALNVVAATNKVMATLVNNSASQFVRIATININVPPQSSSGALLGQTSTAYYALYMRLLRISSATGGTAVTAAAADSADTLSTGISCVSAPTAVTGQGALLHRRDALVTGATGMLWYRVECGTEKNILLRPGEGVAVICESNGAIASGSGTIQAPCDIAINFTQASS